MITNRSKNAACKLCARGVFSRICKREHGLRGKISQTAGNPDNPHRKLALEDRGLHVVQACLDELRHKGARPIPVRTSRMRSSFVNASQMTEIECKCVHFYSLLIHKVYAKCIWSAEV